MASPSPLSAPPQQSPKRKLLSDDPSLRLKSSKGGSGELEAALGEAMLHKSAALASEIELIAKGGDMGAAAPGASASSGGADGELAKKQMK
eukprot:5779648-Alexandrium_andersonii.AAC.1